MKIHITIGMLLLMICNTPVLAEHYYYYHGEKIPLVVSTDSVTIYTKPANTSMNNPFDSITVSTIPIEMLNQISTQGDINLLSVEYIIGDSTETLKMSNSFYIKLYESADTTLLRELIEETNTHLLGEVPFMDQWYEVVVANSTISNTLEMSNYFYESRLFADVDPGFIFEFTTNCVSDSDYGLQWALPAINACESWNYTKGDPNLVVAIIDKGINTEHSEFANTQFVHPYDCYTNQHINMIYNKEDPRGTHGTQVAGVVIANHNAGQIAGITPNVSVMPISHPMNSYSKQTAKELATGISYAWKQGADIINCSWGMHRKEKEFLFFSRILEDALEDALDKGRSGKGCVVVFASGNVDFEDHPFDTRLFYPSYRIPELLVVGNVQNENVSYSRAYDSCYGQKLDVVAPGEGIHTTNLNNGYITARGTSLAAPYVSGIAALILSVRPDLTRQEVVDVIEKTARHELFGTQYEFEDKSGRPNGKWCEEVGYGLVDAYAAVSSVANLYIQNKIYSVPDNPAVERAHTIYAGYAVTDSREYGKVSLRISTDVTYLATNRVVLKSGFHAHAGSNLHVKIVDELYDPIATTPSAPQRIAPRSSSASADNTDTSDKVVIGKDLEDIETENILSTSIYTISGQLIQTIAGSQYDVSHLPNGMYILHHRMSDGSVNSEKIAHSR